LRARQLLERAEQAEALSSNLLQMAPDALIAIDAERRIKFFNDSARIAFGESSKLAIGQPLSQSLPELDRRLQNHRVTETLHLPDVRVGERLFSPTARTLTSGKSFDTILALRDITEMRRRDERRLDFYSIIAHDLRTPLNTITLRTQLLLSGARGALPAAVETDLNKMDGNLKSLVEMINDFLDLARLDNVAYELKNEEVDLGALVRETLEQLRPQLDAHALQWSVEVDDSAHIVGDARRLQQVLNNLIGNAVKFTSDAGTIDVLVTRVDRAVEVSVSDTGRGIPAEQLRTIFDRYTRATNSRETIPGTGLGLMIVREIVEAHGGSVGVESTVGTGSRFWFRVPQVATAA
jgi:two-component system phosphate regulon sensor histidine kinase PhoR